MKTNATCPIPPGAPEKEKGPTHRTNDKKDQSSENAHKKDASDSERNQGSLDSDLSLEKFSEAALKPLDPEDLTSFTITDDRGQSVVNKPPVPRMNRQGILFPGSLKTRVEVEAFLAGSFASRNLIKI